MNDNQSAEPSINIEAEYVAACRSLALVAQHIQGNPETHLAAIRNIGAASSHLEVSAQNIDNIYRGAKNSELKILMQTQRISQLEDMLAQEKEIKLGLIERLDAYTVDDDPRVDGGDDA